MLERLIREGVDAIRLNFSHGSHEEHGNRLRRVRTLEKKFGWPIAVIADLQGPKMRIGKLPEEGIDLKEGEIAEFDASLEKYDGSAIPLPSPVFKQGAKKGARVLFDDGLLEVEIINVRGSLFTTRVHRGGMLFSKKGVNVPELELRKSILEKKDREDMAFAVKSGADYIALSFLRNAADIRVARKLLGSSPIKIIAKIERPEALENLDEIIEAADAVMVARGDLGIETPLWELPVRQKQIIERAHAHMKPVIVATQMLDSMIRNPIPTRAEVSDVANAVFDQADAVMLSGESASGKYPVEAVRMMRRTLEATEKYVPSFMDDDRDAIVPVSMSVAKSAKYIASEIGAKFIFIGTASGFTAQAVACHRPETPIISITDNERIARSLALVWGINSIFLKQGKSTEARAEAVMKQLIKAHELSPKDRVVYVSGRNVGETGQTNRITVLSAR